jgi:DNA-directed RNA polymerase specialized sigma24 family protein
LATVATNRWLDYKRRQARFVAEPADMLGTKDPAMLPGPDPAGAFARETTLVRLLGESLQTAFEQASPEGLVLLRLVYVHGLSQREVGRMLGWSESKLSRFLTAAMKQIEQDTLRELRARDRWLELTWQDFVELCQTQQIGLG